VVNHLVNKWTMQANILGVTHIANQAGWQAGRQAGSHTHFSSYMAHAQALMVLGSSSGHK
jgi:predicted RNA binding protein YcfA (HicA-like mRNA interferase family)